MSAELRDLCRAAFAGPMACHAETLAFEADPEAIPFTGLAEGSVLDDLLARFGREHPGGDARAVASYWSQFYFAGTLIPLTLLCLTADRPVRLDLAGLRIRFCPDRGTPRHLHVAGTEPPRSGEALFHELMDRHVAAAVATLQRRCGLSARLLWENAGGYVAWIAGEVAREGSARSRRAERLLRDETWPAAAFTFAHLKQAALAAEPPVRRLCCLRYCLPSVRRCPGSCPLRPTGAGPCSPAATTATLRQDVMRQPGCRAGSPRRARRS